ncbi:hypothetical protein K474DRAFT_1714392 [Panus rudis PR-1116 ss-1]|nr:hypothetical protein K474DRAFT_1714392 [Panus rudis PR-1116 ss-1]
MYDQLYFVPAPSPAVYEKPTRSSNVRVHNVDSMEQYFDSSDFDNNRLVKAVIYPTGGHKQQLGLARVVP